MLKRPSVSLLLLAAGLAVQCTPLTASAATYYWDPTATGGGAVGGTGVWGGPLLNWSTADTGGTNVAWLNGLDASIGGTASAVTLGAPITVGAFTFASITSTVTTTSGNALTINGGIKAVFSTARNINTITGAGGVVMNGNQTVEVTNGLNISTALSGSGTLTKTGVGSLGLSVAGTYTGKFVVNGGMLGVSSDAALGVVPTTFQADAITLNGGTLTAGGVVSGPFHFNNPGNVTLDANRGITLGASGGTFQIGYGTASTLTINGVISGAGALTKGDGGILVINSTSAYTGKTVIINGTVQLGSQGTTGTLGAGQVEFSGTSTASTLAFNRSDNGTFSNDILISAPTGRANVTTPNSVAVTLGGVISGPGEFWANGNIVLTGANTYGATNVRGNLQVGAGGTTGNLGTGKIAIGTGSSNFLTFNRSDDMVLANDIDASSGGRVNIGATNGKKVTLTGVFAGTANGSELWVQGTGIVAIEANAASNRTRNTIVASGALQVSDLTRNANSALGTGLLFLGNASTPNTGAGLIYTGASVATDGIYNIQTPYAFIDVTNANTVLSIISGFGTAAGNLLTKRGTGTLSFEGGNDNVRMRVQMEGGTLLLAKTVVAAHAVAGNDALILNSGTVRITGDGGDQIYDPSTIQVNGGILDLNGRNEGFNGFSGSTSSGVITNTQSGTTSVLTIGTNNGTSVYSGKLQNGAGNLGLAKTGTGSLTLEGQNTVGGGANVTNGRLIVSGSLTGGLTQISGDSSTGTYIGGVLGGTGTVGAVTTIRGVVAPGATPTGSGLGTLRMGTLDMSSFGTLEIALSTSTLEASLLQIEGDLALGFSAAVLRLSDIGSAVGIAGNPVFKIMSYTGTWDTGTFLFGSIGDLADDSTFVFGQNTYRIDYDAVGATAGTKEVTLTVVVPEPATGGMLAAGLALLGLHWRRKSGLNRMSNRSLPI